MFKNNLFQASFGKFKDFFYSLLRHYFLKQKKSKNKNAQTVSEDDLYSLDGYQLKNLFEKNIYFDFFQLDSLNEEMRQPGWNFQHDLSRIPSEDRNSHEREGIKKEQEYSNKLSINYEIKKHLQKAQLKTKENILSQLKNEDVKKPIVLICNTGESSKEFSRALRAKGFVNVYFMRNGFQSLIEEV